MNEVPYARREGVWCCFLMHGQIRSDRHRSRFIVEQTSLFSEQLEMLDKKKGVPSRLSKKPSAPCFDPFSLLRLSLAPILRCPTSGTEERLYQPQRILKGERIEGLTPNRQVPFQAAQPIGKRDAACQVFRTERAEQEHRKVCCCPAPAGILQHIEGCRIRPLRIIDEEDEGRTSRQGAPKTRDCLEQAGTSLCFTQRQRRGQSWDLLAEFRQQPGQLSEPDVTEQCLGVLFAVQARAQRLDQRLIGQAVPRLKGARFKHTGSLRSCPPQEFPCQPCLADARLPLNGRYLRVPSQHRSERRDQRVVLGGAPGEWEFPRLPWRRRFVHRRFENRRSLGTDALRQHHHL